MTKYGWKPDLPDARDHIYSSVFHVPSQIINVDLRPTIAPPVNDQGPLGSCTGNGIAEIHWSAQKIQKVKVPMSPSRLFIYYNERVMEGTVDSDAGASIRDGIKSIAQQGVCSEYRWPYKTSKFAVQPTKECYKLAVDHNVTSYQRVVGLDQMRLCLAGGFPFTIGFSVYESFESDAVAATGMVPMPQATEQMLGGHCVSVYGCNDTKKQFICLNSWGTKWGDKGFFYMPYAYFGNTNLADDAWTIRSVKIGK